MSVITLPWSMEQDRENQIKANSVHVDDNFNTLLTAVNGKLDLDGSSTPTADISMGSHKLTSLATPTVSGDATTKGYVDAALLLKADLASPTFTGTPAAPTPSASDNSTKIATTEFVVDVLKAMYPVGALYIGTQNTCPMSSLFGTWTLVSGGHALWTGNGTSSSGTTSNANYANAPANTTIAAGAPSISHTHTTYYKDPGNSSGANGGVGGGSYFGKSSYASASNSSVNAIYGKSSTIQPPAYVVNVWRRTA